MHIHILGICGTFMGGVAALARAAGFRVTGCDAAVYPPMSTQLRELGIEIYEGFDAAQLDPQPVLLLGPHDRDADTMKPDESGILV